MLSTQLTFCLIQPSHIPEWGQGRQMTWAPGWGSVAPPSIPAPCLSRTTEVKSPDAFWGSSKGFSGLKKTTSGFMQKTRGDVFRPSGSPAFKTPSNALKCNFQQPTLNQNWFFGPERPLEGLQTVGYAACCFPGPPKGRQELLAQ